MSPYANAPPVISAIAGPASAPGRNCSPQCGGWASRPRTLVGIDVLGRTGLGPDGSVIHEPPVGAVTSAWSRIWRPLRQAMPDARYNGAKALLRIEQHAAGVTAIFADGARAEAGVLIAADGLHSTVRAQLFPDLAPRYAGYVAWRGVVEPHQLAPELHELMFRRMVFGFPDGELMLSIPMPLPQGKATSDAAISSGFGRLMKPRSPRFAPMRAAAATACSIPPPLIRPELIAGIKRDAAALLAPQLAALVTGTAQIILQPIFDLKSPRSRLGRVALIGDAAFVARPHVASGVMKAAVDAETLADALAASRRRYGSRAATLQRRSASLTAHGWSSAAATSARRSQAATRSPRLRIETVMREYGAAGLVRDQAIAARGAG